MGLLHCATAGYVSGDVAHETLSTPLEPTWGCRYIIDAAGQKLGRLATLAATYVRGKHAPTYSPSMDMGAMLVIINAEQVIMSGDKMNQKTYMRHVNGKPGSYTIEPFKELQNRIPERIIEKAVYGMLPKGRLGRRIRLNMKVLLPLLLSILVTLCAGFTDSPEVLSSSTVACHEPAPGLPCLIHPFVVLSTRCSTVSCSKSCSLLLRASPVPLEKCSKTESLETSLFGNGLQGRLYPNRSNNTGASVM